MRQRARAALAALLLLAPVGRPLAVVEAPDLDLLRQEGELKRDTEVKLQGDVIDPILGRDRARVFVDVELEVMAQRRETNKAGAGMAERYREKSGAAKSAGFATQFILPGIPKPKSLSANPNAPPEKPQAAQAQVASQERGEQEEIFGLKPIVKRLLVTVIHDDRVPKDKLELVRSRIVDALAKFKATPQQVVFKSTRFNVRPWIDDLKQPAVYIPLLFALLSLLLLLFLFGPLARFLRRYVEALREKPAAEVNVESKIEPPEEEEEGPGGLDEGKLDIMLGRKPPEPPPSEEEDEDMKKFEPFSYINEDNLKRLANLFLLRREEPWLIAVVLSYLKPEYARQILTSLPVDLQAKVAMEALKVRQVTREQVVAIDSEIKENVDFVVGGMERLVQMLEEADTQSRQNILEYLKNEKPGVYEKVRRFILTFEDVVGFPDRDMQLVVRELKTEMMARALQGASPDVVNKFLGNMSAGAAALLKESMEYAKGLTQAQVEEERGKIMDLVKSLEKEGKISVRGSRLEGAAEAFQEELAIDREERYGARPAPAPGAGAQPGAPAPDPAQAAAYLQAGEQCFQAGKIEESLPYFRQAVELDPKSAPAYQYLAGALYQLGRQAEALACYERLLELQPDPQLKAWVESCKAQAQS